MQDAAKTYTLFELQQGIKQKIAENFAFPIWIVAEINTLTRHRTGHCYLELVQKSKSSNNLVAQARATIWANRFSFISAYFRNATGYDLAAGQNVMIEVTVSYHELYGMSLNITNINPTFTLGDMERAKKEIIEQLIQDGVFDMNKALGFPAVIQNVAVISSSSAAGYGDFVKHISTNMYGYKIQLTLYDSIMQGENTEMSVLNALDKISEEIEKYDAIAIIRGGGSKNDLSCFDNYNIAYMITQFPLPVITGIGHEKDESIVDLVAHTQMKTPTAVADFIIDYNASFEQQIDILANDIFTLANDIITSNEMHLNNLTMSILKIHNTLIKHIERCNDINASLRRIVQLKFQQQSLKLKYIEEKINNTPNRLKEINNKLSNISFQTTNLVKHKLETQKQKLEYLDNRVRLNDPRTILKRGYSISRINGKIVNNVENINAGDKLETILFEGKITSIVEK